jgi:serine/threonine protein kinase
VALKPNYWVHRDGSWHLCVHREEWSPGLWAELLRQLKNSVPGHHPVTRNFRYPNQESRQEFYLKIYGSSPPLGALKDLCRDSKAFRALKQGEALSELGFHVPLAVAAGEERRFRFLRKAFLLTRLVEGSSLPIFLQNDYSMPSSASLLRQKRESLKQLALEVRRLHRLGFVHGDLVPSNILVRAVEGGILFFFLDNDRTRRYPVWFSRLLWKRNLVQLNRFVLPGISLQDRMRFLEFYLGEKPRRKSHRRLLRWLEKETRKRRQECDNVEAQVSFRELMRWKGPFAKSVR